MVSREPLAQVLVIWGANHATEVGTQREVSCDKTRIKTNSGRIVLKPETEIELPQPLLHVAHGLYTWPVNRELSGEAIVDANRQLELPAEHL